MNKTKEISLQTKICKHCGQELPITEFGINNSKDAKDGLQSWCHSCMAEYNRLKSVHRDTGVKVCRKCGAIKPRSEFNANKKHKDGLQSYCKECDREHGRLKNGYTGEYR